MSNWTALDIPLQTGRIAVITGANSGLGYETALALARKGAEVIMACRNLEKGRTARDHILDIIPNANLKLMALDLGSLASIYAFADTFKAECNRLDMLFNNAGVMAPPRQTTADGFESQIGINHLGHFALTGLLLAPLLNTPNSRIINVTSSAQYFGKINFNDLQSQKSYSRYGAYGQSKLANVLFTRDLQRRLDLAGANSISVAAHPGLSHTNLQKNTVEKNESLMEKLVYGLMMPLMSQSPAQGAWPQLYAATMPHIEGGEHFAPDGMMEMRGHPQRTDMAKAAYDVETAQRLWDVSEALTGIDYAPLKSPHAQVSGT